jgi:hypothetical protein
MPLWLQAIVETVLMTIASLAVVLVLLLCGWASMGFPGGVEPVLGGAGQLWLAAHGVGLRLDVAAPGGGPEVTGLATFTPLGLTLLLLLFARRSGSRLAQASYEGQFWQPVLSSALTYAVLGAGISLASGSQALSTSVVASAIVPVWVVLAGAVWGGHRVSGSWLRLLGIRRERLIERYNQYTRWAGAYIVSVLRAAWVGLLGVVAAGALLTGVAIVYNWNDAIALQQSLHAGLLGDAVLALFQFAILPNLVVFGMAWGLGAGFSLGEGTLISPAVTDAAGLPALPILGAVPAGTGPWSFAVLALPVLAGALAGWWFVRAGENHLDEWLALKIRQRWLSAALSGTALALAVGLLVGAGTALLAVLSRGSLGVGRFTDVGPDPLLTGLWALVTVGVGVVIGQVLSPVLEREGSSAARRRAAGGEAAATAEDALPEPTRRERRSARRRERRVLKASSRRAAAAGKGSAAPQQPGEAPEGDEARAEDEARPETAGRPGTGSAAGADAGSAGAGELTALQRLRGVRAGAAVPLERDAAEPAEPAAPWTGLPAEGREEAPQGTAAGPEPAEAVKERRPAAPARRAEERDSGASAGDAGLEGAAAGPQGEAPPAGAEGAEGSEEARPVPSAPATGREAAGEETRGEEETAGEETRGEQEADGDAERPAEETPRPEPRRVVVARPRRRRPRS